jgi:hypothetical protein
MKLLFIVRIPSIVNALERDNAMQTTTQKQCDHSQQENEQLLFILPYAADVWSALGSLITIGGCESHRLRVGAKVELLFQDKNKKISRNDESKYKTGIVVDLDSLTNKAKVVVPSIDRPLVMNTNTLHLIPSVLIRNKKKTIQLGSTYL